MNRSGTYKTIRVRHPYQPTKDPHRVKDIQRIQNAMLMHGYYATSEQCEEMWEMNSDDVCASWLVLPADDESIYREIKQYFEEVK